MNRRPYDPLRHIPDPDVVRAKLKDTLELASRLKILLELAERIRDPKVVTQAGIECDCGR